MGRPRRNWTEQEDALLRRAVAEALAKSRLLLWSEIAKSIPGRSNKDCRRRWYNTLAGETAKGPWSDAEDARLIEAVSKLGPRWSQVAKAVASRSADQCASHWTQVLDPDISYCDWTDEEDQSLLHAIIAHGTNWATIAASHSPKRSTLALKNRYSTLRLRMRNQKRGSSAGLGAGAGTGIGTDDVVTAAAGPRVPSNSGICRGRKRRRNDPGIPSPETDDDEEQEENEDEDEGEDEDEEEDCDEEEDDDDDEEDNDVTEAWDRLSNGANPGASGAAATMAGTSATAQNSSNHIHIHMSADAGADADADAAAAAAAAWLGGDVTVSDSEANFMASATAPSTETIYVGGTAFDDSQNFTRLDDMVSFRAYNRFEDVGLPTRGDMVGSVGNAGQGSLPLSESGRIAGLEWEMALEGSGMKPNANASGADDPRRLGESSPVDNRGTLPRQPEPDEGGTVGPGTDQTPTSLGGSMYRISVSMLCTPSQLRVVMSGLPDTGQDIRIHVEPQ